jgi:hypothetical protein
MVVFWLLAVVVGLVAGGVSYWLGSTDPVLTATLVLTYTVGTRLSLHHPDIVYEADSPAWAVGKWSGAATAVVLVAAFFGVNQALAVADGLRLSLQLLVVGVGYTAWAFGVAYARAKASA